MSHCNASGQGAHHLYTSFLYFQSVKLIQGPEAIIVPSRKVDLTNGPVTINGITFAKTSATDMPNNDWEPQDSEVLVR